MNMISMVIKYIKNGLTVLKAKKIGINTIPMEIK